MKPPKHNRTHRRLAYFDILLKLKNKKLQAPRIFTIKIPIHKITKAWKGLRK